MRDGSGGAREIGPHLKLIWGTRSTFLLLRAYQGPSRLVTVFLGTLWRYMKDVKAPFVFDGEHRLSLHAMQWNRASSHSGGEVSLFFSSCSRNLGYVLELWWDGPSKFVF